jgi:excisionase family DNA binding protein
LSSWQGWTWTGLDYNDRFTAVFKNPDISGFGRSGPVAHFWKSKELRVTASLKGSAVVTRPTETESLLTPAEVAAMFRVDPKTVTRWAKAGKLSAIRTLGGHRRYRESEVKELLGDVIPAQRSARD